MLLAEAAENKDRAALQKRYSIFQASFALAIYTLIHALVLTMEMLITHVVLTLHSASFFQFVLATSLVEIKISAFKKCDYAGLLDYTNLDSLDRFHTVIYMLATFFQTSQDLRSVTRSALTYFFIKIAVDWIKHFYLTQMNKLNIQFYSGLRNDIYRKLFQWPL